MKEVVEFLKQLVKIPSITDSQEEICPIVLIQKLLTQHNISYRIYGKGTKLNLVARFGKSKKSILLNSHFDVVPARSDMFIPREKSGKLYARGVSDAKGPLVAMLFAFLQLKKEILPGKVILSLVCDEENAGTMGTKILAQKGIIADYNIIGEPTNNEILISHRGFLRLNITIVGKEHHASFPHHRENAIVLASRVVKALEKFDFKQNHKDLGQATLSFGLISGGRKINIGAGKCELSIDIRYLPNQSEEIIIKTLKNLLSPIAKITIDVIDHGKPFEISSSSFLLKTAKKYASVSKIGKSFGATDARYYMPKEAIVLGPGNHEVAHHDGEFITLSDIERAIHYYVGITKSLLKES